MRTIGGTLSAAARARTLPTQQPLLLVRYPRADGTGERTLLTTR